MSNNGGQIVGKAIVSGAALPYWGGGRAIGRALVHGGSAATINPNFLLVAGECPVSYPAKLIAGEVTLGMDMTGLIPPGLTISGISTAISVYSGVDDDAGEVLEGGPSLIGNIILQPVREGVALNTYAVTFEAVLSDGSVIAANGFLPVTPF